MVSSALASCLEEAVAAASSSGEPASMLIGFESCANAAADCMKAALAKATAHGDAQVKVLASMVACVALQPELPESIANSDSAQGSLWTTVASTLQPDMDEVGVAALTLSSSAGDDAFAWVGPFFVRAWAFLRWYNAIQLVVMPWVIAWLFSGCLIGIMRFVRFQYHIWRTGIDVAALLLLNVLILVEDFVSSCCSGLFGLVNRNSHDPGAQAEELREPAGPTGSASASNEHCGIARRTRNGATPTMNWTSSWRRRGLVAARVAA